MRPSSARSTRLVLVVIAMALGAWAVVGLGGDRAGGEAAKGAVAPVGKLSPGGCVECHRPLHPELVRAHEVGPHANHASCADCHGTDHAQIFSLDGEVSSAKCGSCHAEAYAQFGRSKHGKLLRQGSMADTLRAHPVAVGGCQATNGCHDVQRPNADGSVGRCASCHASHAATKGVAADPQICARCHDSPDHPVMHTWANDKHGVLWKQDPTSSTAPSCITCHMPGKTHDDGLGLTHSVVARAGARALTLVTPMSKEAHAKARAHMLEVCAKCHGMRLSRETLDAADDARFDALLLCEEAAQIVKELDAEGLLVPAPRDRPENPLTNGALALGGKQIYDEGSSRAERLYYDMFMFQFPALWRAAYHTDPNVIRWPARERLKTSLIELRAEAERLRSAKSSPPPHR